MGEEKHEKTTANYLSKRSRDSPGRSGSAQASLVNQQESLKAGEGPLRKAARRPPPATQ